MRKPNFSDEFKREAATQITEREHPAADVSQRLVVSPQVPERLDIGTRHDLGFTIVSDPDNRLDRHLGITFEPEDKLPVKPGDNWIGALTGTGTWELPQPTVLILNQNAKVRFIDASPDWLARMEADLYICRPRSLLRQAVSALSLAWRRAHPL